MSGLHCETVYPFFFFFAFFGVGTQGLMLARQELYHWSHASRKGLFMKVGKTGRRQ
jgi:hypothetical protein